MNMIRTVTTFSAKRRLGTAASFSPPENAWKLVPTYADGLGVAYDWNNATGSYRTRREAVEARKAARATPPEREEVP